MREACSLTPAAEKIMENEPGKLKLAEQYAAVARKCVTDQRELISELQENGRDTTSAEDVLRTFEGNLVRFESYCNSLRRGLRTS